MKFVIKVACGKKKFNLEFSHLNFTVLDLKTQLFDNKHVAVEPKYQKMLINGKIREDGVQIKDCDVKMKVGTENVIIKCLILIKKGHKDNIRSKDYLEKSDKVLEAIEKDLNDIKMRVKARMITFDDVVFELTPIEERLLRREAEIKDLAADESLKTEIDLKFQKILKLKEIIESIRLLLSTTST